MSVRACACMCVVMWSHVSNGNYFHVSLLSAQIEMGSTSVRLGTAVFGPRATPSAMGSSHHPTWSGTLSLLLYHPQCVTGWNGISSQFLSNTISFISTVTTTTNSKFLYFYSIFIITGFFLEKKKTVGGANKNRGGAVNQENTIVIFHEYYRKLVDKFY